MAEEEKGKTKSRIELLEERIAELETSYLAVLDWQGKAEKSGLVKKAGLFGGKRERMAMRDTQTGMVYVSKSALGRELAAEADTDPTDHFAWYKLMAKFPDRFVEASEAEKAKVEKEEEERLAAELATAEAAEAK